MSSIIHNELWRGFIRKYKSLPELWKTTDGGYKNKNTRQEGWEILLEDFKRIDPNATLDTLKKRINNMRTCYRRELKKIEESEQSGLNNEYLYKPTLWYFDEFEFLRDQETDLPKISFFDIDIDIKEDPDEPSQVTKKLKIQEDPRESILQRPDRDEIKGYQIKDSSGIRDNSSWTEIVAERDEATIYADAWAVSYRKLNETQRLYAKKAIEEILILGQLGQLTLNSVSINTR